MACLRIAFTRARPVAKNRQMIGAFASRALLIPNSRVQSRNIAMRALQGWRLNETFAFWRRPHGQCVRNTLMTGGSSQPRLHMGSKH